MSTEHDVKLVCLGEIVKHTNADSLGITEVDGRPCIVRLEEWKPGDLAIYVPIDSLCPVSDPRFAFLAKSEPPDDRGLSRVRALRLRGAFSMGLLVKPSKDDLDEAASIAHCQGLRSDSDSDLRFHLGIELYEPPEPSDPDAERDPGFLPHYSIESARKWAPKVLVEGEEVVLHEKIHGETGRFAFHRDRLWIASAANFKRLDTENRWTVVAQGLDLERRLRTVPGIAVYGEVYGNIPKMRYDGRSDAPQLALFDALDIAARRWLDHDETVKLAEQLGLRHVPLLFRGPWSSTLATHAEGATTVPGAEAHVREGWVLKPVKERTHPELGRVILKRHGEGYLTRKGG